jgi:acid phosphatase type 7
MRAALVFLLCAGSALAADKLVGGPYVVYPAARTATIGWVVETGAAEVSSATGPARRVPVLRSERITLTGLRAGETMQYQIPDIPGTTPEDRKGSFTVPPAGAADFRFVVFGDTRTRDDLHRRIAQAIAATEPEFVIHTGDLVADGFDTLQWPNFFSIEKELLRKTVFFPVMGNHERDNARFYEFFDVKTPYYSFDWGRSHFIVIDSDVSNVSGSSVARERFWTEQERWLEDDLARNRKAEFRFVVMHHPPFTVNQTASHMSKQTPTLIPLFEKEKVTAVFGGHDHNYQHHVKNGIHYIVTGGGGAPLAPADPALPGITVKVESTEHYVAVRIQGGKAHIEAIALDGRNIETIDLAAGAQ